ncbi:TetR/AcrR family transcriptional regulator [uncultured Ruegeria sp.]|uniref:TetR/AcrR family transcriptional regulator n=1 Tax=uncultured Ruegeria sp. TaxID=259304 RepID=UPI00260FCEA2|nr:TetR/AcrR family transcriptional regulator [uncultured Ruegeria sp.]
MTKSSRVGRPTKSTQRLSKPLILQTALPIFQEQGADALSFRLLAEQLKVTPMAVTYHTGNKRQLLADLVDLAFKDALPDIADESPSGKAHTILLAYCQRALLNANLLRAVLEDVSLMSQDLDQITIELQTCTQQLAHGDDDNVLLNLLIDYTHGFVFSASSGKNNTLTIKEYQCGIEWILVRASNDADR